MWTEPLPAQPLDTQLAAWFLRDLFGLSSSELGKRSYNRNTEAHVSPWITFILAISYTCSISLMFFLNVSVVPDLSSHSHG